MLGAVVPLLRSASPVARRPRPAAARGLRPFGVSGEGHQGGAQPHGKWRRPAFSVGRIESMIGVGWKTEDLKRLRDEIDRELKRRKETERHRGSAPPSVRRGTDTPPRDKSEPRLG